MDTEQDSGVKEKRGVSKSKSKSKQLRSTYIREEADEIVDLVDLKSISNVLSECKMPYSQSLQTKLTKLFCSQQVALLLRNQARPSPSHRLQMEASRLLMMVVLSLVIRHSVAKAKITMTLLTKRTVMTLPGTVDMILVVAVTNPNVVWRMTLVMKRNCEKYPARNAIVRLAILLVCAQAKQRLPCARVSIVLWEVQQMMQCLLNPPAVTRPPVANIAAKRQKET